MVKIGILEATPINSLLCKIYGNHLYSDNFKEETMFISRKANSCFIIVDMNCIKGNKNIMLTEKDILLLNSDNRYNLRDFKLYNTKVITYGLNLKACITVSSIRDEYCKSVQVCIQRAIPTVSGKLVEEQEFPIRIANYKDVNAVLPAVAVALINDIHPDHIKSCVF